MTQKTQPPTTKHILDETQRRRVANAAQKTQPPTTKELTTCTQELTNTHFLLNPLTAPPLTELLKEHKASVDQLAMPYTLHRRLLSEHLLRIISGETDPIPVATLYTLSPHSSPFQIQRSLNDLLRMGQIERPARGFYAPAPATPVFPQQGTAATTSSPPPVNNLKPTAATTPTPQPADVLNITTTITPISLSVNNTLNQLLQQN